MGFDARADQIGISVANGSPPLRRFFRVRIFKIFNSSDGRVVWSVCLLSCRLGFDSESGQTNDFKIGIHSFPVCRSALKGQCGEQAGKFTCCAVGKGT